MELVLPADADEFLNHLPTLKQWQGEEDPYWARLWPTALEMAAWMATQTWPAGTEALELGCGIGVLGLAALLANLRVTFNDYIPLAVDLALENARRNGQTHAAGLIFDWRDSRRVSRKALLALALSMILLVIVVLLGPPMF